MKIKVTQEHIAKGKPQRSEWCPIALAAKDVFPQEIVVVSPYDLQVIAEQRDRYWHLPAQVRQFIKDFDGGRPVEPFDFELAAAQ